MRVGLANVEHIEIGSRRKAGTQAGQHDWGVGCTAIRNDDSGWSSRRTANNGCPDDSRHRRIRLDRIDDVLRGRQRSPVRI